MPVSKPLQTFGDGMQNVTAKARQSAGQNRNALNAALGVDNFSSLLSNTKAENAYKSAELQDAHNAHANKAASRAVPRATSANDAAMLGAPVSSNNPLLQAAGMGTAAPLLHNQTATPQSLQNSAPAADGAAPPSNAINSKFGPPSESYNPAAGVPRARRAVNPGIVGNMTQTQKLMMLSENPLGMLNTINSLNSLDSLRPEAGADSAILAMRTAANRAARTASNKLTTLTENIQEKINSAIGTLSGRFESGSDGIAAIGYDKTGGTSYGKYQIASRTGTMDSFISFLDKNAPELAQELKQAGPANTGSKNGAMPEAWKTIAAREPEKFETLQHNFIMQQHFEPAMAKLANLTGLDQSKLSNTMQEVLFSTAVQHGPSGAGRILARAFERVGMDNFNTTNTTKAAKAEEMVIKQVYTIRSGQFQSSTSQVQAAVKSRLQTEMQMALNMAREKA